MTIETPQTGTVITYQTLAVGDGNTYTGTVVASDVMYQVAKSFFDVDAYRTRVVANGHANISTATDARYLIVVPMYSTVPIVVSLEWINESTYGIIAQNTIITIKVGFTNGNTESVLNAIRGLGYSAALA